MPEDAFDLSEQAPASARLFVEKVRAMGIGQPRIFVEDLELFLHPPLQEAIEAAIKAAPFDPLPLESITIVGYAGKASFQQDLKQFGQQLSRHQEALQRFAVDYNIHVTASLHLRALEEAGLSSLLELAGSDALDGLNLYYDFTGADTGSVHQAREALAGLAQHDCVNHPAVRFGNFPSCFFPEEAFQLAYREAVAPLKGKVGSQRDLIQDIRRRKPEFHSACTDCRCRQACYALTEMEEHRLPAAALRPRHKDAVVFAGGSLQKGDVASIDPQLVWTGPAEQGDLAAAVLEGFQVLLIVDGYFYTRFPCTTQEVMLALEQGVDVFGASSIGALRAVELDAYGMQGEGYVYQHLKSHRIKPYHLVAQTYDENNRPLTPPLIELTARLEQALEGEDGAAETAAAMLTLAEEDHFSAFSMDQFLKRLRNQREVDPGLLDAVEETGRRDVKQEDAGYLVDHFRDLIRQRGPSYVSRHYEAMHEQTLEHLYDTYPGEPDLGLPDFWEEAGTGKGDRVRGLRTRSSEETLRLAEAFFAGMAVTAADTSRYDDAGQHILSVFFPGFYYMDYYPASATGNGEDRTTALASAYMELFERLPACGLHIRQEPKERWPGPFFPESGLPQFANWGMHPEVKQKAIDAHGYVKVSDLLKGGDVVVPKCAVMFAYSGTDGLASGNSLPEAVLYGLYEVVERDTCQLHVADTELRKRRAMFRIDPSMLEDTRSRDLLRKAEARGCWMVLFLLPNLYDLPCVMVEVYDQHRAIQCHGGVAVRADLESAAYAALREAYMQYISYFAGTRDDYHEHVSLKQARQAYRSAKVLYEDRPSSPNVPESIDYTTVKQELEALKARLARAGVEHILAADLSPYDGFGLKSVKVIVPGLELWFCPHYQPSPSFGERVQRLRDAH